MLNTLMKNGNTSFANISILFLIMFTALKHYLLTFQLKSLKQFATYDNIYANQLKLKNKNSEVTTEGKV